MLSTKVIPFSEFRKKLVKQLASKSLDEILKEIKELETSLT